MGSLQLSKQSHFRGLQHDTVQKPKGHMNPCWNTIDFPEVLHSKNLAAFKLTGILKNKKKKHQPKYLNKPKQPKQNKSPN